jgi:hypothetical protein
MGDAIFIFMLIVIFFQFWIHIAPLQNSSLDNDLVDISKL